MRKNEKGSKANKTENMFSCFFFLWVFLGQQQQNNHNNKTTKQQEQPY